VKRGGPFIIVGMGRSGTSYLGSILHAAGIEMGAALKPGDHFNRRGYFEDVETTQMHEDWLKQRGLTFMSVSDRLPVQAADRESGKIAAYVAQREASGRPWGVKAPGILFFWPAWRERLPPETVVLLPFRHPTAVVGSFERWGLAGETTLRLWEQLNRLALAALDEGPFQGVVLNFDDRFAFGRRLQALLGAYVDPFEPALVNHHPRPDLLSPELRRLYDELVARSQSTIA
jgi:hypothetical protein